MSRGSWRIHVPGKSADTGECQISAMPTAGRWGLDSHRRACSIFHSELAIFLHRRQWISKKSEQPRGSSKHFLPLLFFCSRSPYPKRWWPQVKRTRQELSFFSVLPSLSVTGVWCWENLCFLRSQRRTGVFSLFLLCSASRKVESTRVYALELESWFWRFHKLKHVFLFTFTAYNYI